MCLSRDSDSRETRARESRGAPQEGADGETDIDERSPRNFGRAQGEDKEERGDQKSSGEEDQIAGVESVRG